MEEPLIELEVKDSQNDYSQGHLSSRVLEESKKLWRVAFPAVISRVTQFGVLVVTQAFVGHIGELQLAAYALIQVVGVRFANGILLGMSSATETLCGQAFGAKQYHMMGIYLQRSMIINLSIATFALLPLFIFSTPIFKLLQEDPEIAQEAGKVSLWFIPMLYFFALGLTIQKYLQSQAKNMIVGWLSIASFLTHLILSRFLVSQLKLGVPGAMSSMATSSWLIVLGEIVYVFGGWCSKTWGGFRWAAFSDLIPVFKLSISSGIMLCLEMWYNAVLLLLAGYMKNATVSISAFSICLNIIAWGFMISVGFLAGISVRVSNELGRGDAKAAIFSIKVTLCTSLSIGLVFWALCLVFGDKIGYLFTGDERVVEGVSDLSFLLSLSVLLNTIQPVLSGVAVGAGRQTTVAYINVGCYYVVGIPVGVVLGYVTNLQVKGIWIGMLLGVLSQTLVLAYITWRADWDEEVKKASERLNKWLLSPSDNSKDSVS